MLFLFVKLLVSFFVTTTTQQMSNVSIPYTPEPLEKIVLVFNNTFLVHLKTNGISRTEESIVLLLQIDSTEVIANSKQFDWCPPESHGYQTDTWQQPNNVASFWHTEEEIYFFRMNNKFGNYTRTCNNNFISASSIEYIVLQSDTADNFRGIMACTKN